MRRRDFVKAITATATAWPLAAHAQQSAMPVIGFLDGKSADASREYVTAFRRGLKEAGFIEGQNVAIEFRWADGQNDRLPDLAAELVRRQVTAIVAISPAATLAAKSATTTIPVVFQSGLDPVQAGFVTSLNKPGGNLTGFYRFAGDFVPKCLELLHETFPNMTEFAVLVNSTGSGGESHPREALTAARSLGLQLRVLDASRERDFEPVFASLRQSKIEALVIATDNFLISRSRELAALTLRDAMPAIAPLREFAQAGGLMSYGASLSDQYYQVGIYIGRILRGEKPGELPVQQATKFDLVVNLKTAKALRLKLPQTLVADEVIE
jgi:putative ABC transport system substrate-binding protein